MDCGLVDSSSNRLSIFCGVVQLNFATRSLLGGVHHASVEGARIHVQAYAALAFLALAVLLWVWLPLERRPGDVAGLWLLGAGAAIYFTEFWRDWVGRGSLFNGIIDGPQIAAVFLVLAGALTLRETRTAAREDKDAQPAEPQSPPSTANRGTA